MNIDDSFRQAQKMTQKQEIAQRFYEDNAENIFIDEVIEKLQKTTRKHPYNRNAILRLKIAIEKFENGRYTKGSI